MSEGSCPVSQRRVKEAETTASLKHVRAVDLDDCDQKDDGALSLDRLHELVLLIN